MSNKNFNEIDKRLIIEKYLEYGYISYFKNDKWFINALKQNKIHEQDIVINNLFDIIKKSKTIIDGGAHAGSHTILYKYINKNVSVHAFEPQKKMFALLEHNIYKNNFDNVFLYNNALANIEKTFTMSDHISDIDARYNIFYGTEEESNLGGMKIGFGGEEIKTVTIDSLRLEFCDFIKLDLEGAESLAIYGAIETIKKFRPFILFESNHQQLDESIYKEFNVKQKTTSDILYELGYENIIKIDEYHSYLARW